MAKATTAKKSEDDTQATAEAATAAATESMQAANDQAGEAARQAQQTIIEGTEALREQVAEAMRSPMDYTKVFAMASNNMEACVKANETLLRGMTAINQELAAFAQARVQAASEAAQAMGAVNGGSNPAEASMNYARKTSEQYAAEASKLAAMTSDLQQEYWKALQQCWRGNHG